MKRKSNTGVLLLLLGIFWNTAIASGPFDPCNLLTRQELEALVGEPVGEAELKDSKNPLGQKMCLFSAASSSRLIQVSVIRTEDMAPGMRDHGQSASKIYTTTKNMLDPVEPVSGVGDDACWGAPGLHVLKGEAYVVISVGNTSKRENLDLARRIAGKVLPRL